jgi:hypothetical protein
LVHLFKSFFYLSPGFEKWYYQIKNELVGEIK